MEDVEKGHRVRGGTEPSIPLQPHIVGPSLVAEGVDREDIVAGLHSTIAKRTSSMAKRLGLVPPVAMVGGVAKNRGVVKALEQEIGEPLIVPPEPQIVGAVGAALLAMDDLKSAAGSGRPLFAPSQHGEQQPAPQGAEENRG